MNLKVSKNEVDASCWIGPNEWQTLVNGDGGMLKSQNIDLMEVMPNYPNLLISGIGTAHSYALSYLFKKRQ